MSWWPPDIAIGRRGSSDSKPGGPSVIDVNIWEQGVEEYPDGYLLTSHPGVIQVGSLCICRIEREGSPHQPDSPIGLSLEPLSQPLKVTPEGPRSVVPGHPSFRASPGPDSAALGPALQGYAADGSSLPFSPPILNPNLGFALQSLHDGHYGVFYSPHIDDEG